MRGFLLLGAVLWLGLAGTVLSAQSAGQRELTLYLDAEFQEHLAGARAIEIGLLTAFHVARHRLPSGISLRVVRADHRGNMKRSHRHLAQYLDDDQALAVVGGVHTLSYLVHRDYIDENRILLLLPWAAAGPLTRTDTDENWIYRLSVDDTKAGDRMVAHALATKTCDRPALWLWDTG